MENIIKLLKSNLIASDVVKYQRNAKYKNYKLAENFDNSTGYLFYFLYENNILIKQWRDNSFVISSQKPMVYIGFVTKLNKVKQLNIKYSYWSELDINITLENNHLVFDKIIIN